MVPPEVEVPQGGQVAYLHRQVRDFVAGGVQVHQGGHPPDLQEEYLEQFSFTKHRRGPSFFLTSSGRDTSLLLLTTRAWRQVSWQMEGGR